MEHSALGTQRRQATPRSAHAPRDLRRLVGRAFRRDIRHRREAPSFALVHPRHVLDLRSLNSARRRHFYSTMLPNRIRCISLITNDRDTFYSTKNRRALRTFCLAGCRLRLPKRVSSLARCFAP